MLDFIQTPLLFPPGSLEHILHDLAQVELICIDDGGVVCFFVVDPVA